MGIVEFVARGVPLTLVALALFVAMTLSRELGAVIYRRLRPFMSPPVSGRVDEAHILTAVLGLLALLVAFTFQMALDRFEARRDLVVDEANALSTAYLRSALLDDPAPVHADLRSYAEARLAYSLASERDRPAAALHAEGLQAAVWRDVVEAVRPLRGGPTPGFIAAPINEAFDLATRRKAISMARIPASVVATLGLFVLVTAGMLGYMTADTGGRHRIGSYLMFALLALAIILILDLDRPRSGAIRVSQSPMVEAVTAMRP